MYKNKKISVIIPALNEEKSISLVINDLPGDIADQIIVVDNGSSDNTAQVAQRAGALVLREEKRGYGAACQRGIKEAEDSDIIVILDADYSDYPERVTQLLDPIIELDFDMVLGSRTMGNAEKGSLTIPQRFGNRLATWLIKGVTGFRYTDMGPFRAVKTQKFKELHMKDKNYGWNVEMQIKAVKQGFKIKEVPADYRNRIGESKISGTVSGVIKAGIKIIYSVFRYNRSL
ncbi:MAG: glycosyltransferase family 2 protein [Desulfatiglans sp.]|jgi:glycosyltransferase involved in cell wall biosynthesis|nr:glycosyltransferase family 2 protein [Desulfatiglans sp.]